MATGGGMRSWRVWCRDVVGQSVGADPRSLAFCRVTVAMAIILDLCYRWPDVEALYSDRGVLPRTFLHNQPETEGVLSLYFIGGSVAFTYAMFVFTGVVAGCMMLGHHTRLATCAVWALTISLHNRNTVVLNGGDNYLGKLLFWGMFVPWGKTWSMDSLRPSHGNGRGHAEHAMQPRAHQPKNRCRNAAPDVVLCTGVAGMLLQTVLVYIQTWTLKKGAEWNSDFTAIQLSLSVDVLHLPLGQVLRQCVQCTKVLTYMTMVIEGPFAALLVVPMARYTGPVRTLLVACFVGLQVGIMLTIRIEIFPFIMNAGIVVFLPAWFWDVAMPALCRRLPCATWKREVVCTKDTGSKSVTGSAEMASVPTHVAPRALASARQAVALLALVYMLIDHTGWLSEEKYFCTSNKGKCTIEACYCPSYTQRKVTLEGGGKTCWACVDTGEDTNVGTGTLMLAKTVFTTADALACAIHMKQAGSFSMFHKNIETYDLWWEVRGNMSTGTPVNLLHHPRLGGRCTEDLGRRVKPRFAWCEATWGRSLRWWIYLNKCTYDAERDTAKGSVNLRELSRYLCSKMNEGLDSTTMLAEPSRAYLMEFNIHDQRELTMPDMSERLMEPRHLWQWSCNITDPSKQANALGSSPAESGSRSPSRLLCGPTAGLAAGKCVSPTDGNLRNAKHANSVELEFQSSSDTLPPPPPRRYRSKTEEYLGI